MPKINQENNQFSLDSLEPLPIPYIQPVDHQNIQLMEFQVQGSNFQEPSSRIGGFDPVSRIFDEHNTMSTEQPQNQQINSQAQIHQFSSSISEALRVQRAQRAHLYRSRRTKNTQRDQLELQFEKQDYWTKNVLQNAKKPHFEWIKQKLGLSFIEENELLNGLSQKVGMNMKEYLKLYNLQGLTEIWQEFFRTKFLYRETMLSRASTKRKQVSLKFLFRFEQAFRTGQFDHIA